MKLSSSDPRLVFRVADNKIRLPAYANQSINAVALEAHSGTITVTNTEGKVLATVPYTVAPAKQFSQGASLNYNPFGNTASLNYSISGVSTSPLDPTWSLSVGMGLDLATPSVSSGTINLSVRW
ncbi:hypothetical protein GCM10010844_44260 [Deinococcus radiotolerans]|uniref:DUF4402 domain-containing protein n=1 Tax=Deinococcus radiotolerans TaxID=1309407 RepID=A0ABQ2FRU7_9DEIO|nr:hypothetical protein GCM10010844_44260 [Deinococcus radiotolerans]